MRTQVDFCSDQFLVEMPEYIETHSNLLFVAWYNKLKYQFREDTAITTAKFGGASLDYRQFK